MRIKRLGTSRRHRIGTARMLAAMESATYWVTLETSTGTKLIWIGTDEDGRELNVIGVVDADDEDLILIIHVQPTAYDVETT